MKIVVVAPERPGTVSGNQVTADRWALRLGELGHDSEVVTVDESRWSSFQVADDDPAEGADLLVALHARRCAGVVATSTDHAPQRPVVVALAGTDLYGDLPTDPDAAAAVGTADALVVLQAGALDRLAAFDPPLAAKAHVVHQSVDGPRPERAIDPGAVVIAVLSHLRDVKDPLLTAGAARLLPAESRVVVEHAGVAHDERWAAFADREMADNPRYVWHGGLPRTEALALLARSHALACTSMMEGGANVVTEAIALGVPVLGTRIDGTVGLVGDDYPALVEPGDRAALADLLDRFERDEGFRAELDGRIAALAPLTDPAHERAQWAAVLEAVT